MFLGISCEPGQSCRLFNVQERAHRRAGSGMGVDIAKALVADHGVVATFNLARCGRLV
jgi:hypothetical protein